MALANERCAFFCEHHLGAENKPNRLVFCFHDNHWMDYQKAERRILDQCRVMRGDSDLPFSIHPLKCPCDSRCRVIVTESVAFSMQIKEAMDLARYVRQKGVEMANSMIAEVREGGTFVMPIPKIMWCKCPCGELIMYEYGHEDQIVITCPRCGKTRESEFE